MASSSQCLQSAAACPRRGPLTSSRLVGAESSRLLWARRARLDLWARRARACCGRGELASACGRGELALAVGAESSPRLVGGESSRLLWARRARLGLWARRASRAIASFRPGLACGCRRPALATPGGPARSKGPVATVATGEADQGPPGGVPTRRTKPKARRRIRSPSPPRSAGVPGLTTTTRPAGRRSRLPVMKPPPKAAHAPRTAPSAARLRPRPQGRAGPRPDERLGSGPEMH